MTAAQPAPLVAINVPAYNAERFIGRALESAIGQTYTRLEIVVIGDRSRDGTAEVIHGFEDPRIPYLRQPNHRQGSARNNGIRASTGAYITFLEADDFFLSGKIERPAAFLQARPEFGTVFCNALHFYSDGPLFSRHPDVTGGDIFPALLQSSLINQSEPLMVRCQILRSGLAFREDRYYPEEWDLCLRLSGSATRTRTLWLWRSGMAATRRWTFQRILKKNALEMLERLFASMSEAERAYFHADQVLRRCRFNLAAAYLAGGNKVGFGEVIPGVFPGLTARLLRAAVGLVPAGVVSAATTRFWRWRQVRPFSRKRALALDQVGPLPGLPRERSA